MRACIISPSRWRGPRLSKHFVAEALADAGHDVLYIDPPLSPGSMVRNPARRGDLRAPRDEVAADGLRIWRPLVVPGQSRALGQRVNGRLLEAGLQRRMAPPDLVLAFGVEGRALLRSLRGRRVYWCTDSLEDLPGVDPVAMRAREQAMVDAADVVVACSKPLAAQLRSRGASVTYVPHACEPASLVSAAHAPVELASLPRPLVGYVGSINFRVHVDLLRAARDATDGTLVVVGGGLGPSPSPAVVELLASERVVAAGHRDAAELPAWLSALDVAVVPYADHPFNRKSFPIKILQHLAAGTPVVSTPNGATDEHADVVEVVTSADAMAVAVAAAAGGRGRGTVDSRRAAASRRSWSDAVGEVLAVAGVDP